ncbi:retropepsin-like aspartic protease [Aliamphritea hakodatensis]|uniref:retropepsin-like aspartic protease n=1 Tax=Aliamphritea hakodatensis TaxID=2895352 RepID=UPI0022FD7AED|nr:retropepsin-like aspartic protease [Aliamphritea hakodatensis]
MLVRIRVAILCGLCVLAGTAGAEVFHYVTETGRKVYVSSLHKVPAQYRDQIDIKQNGSAALTAEQKRDQQQQREQARNETETRREIRRLEALRDKMRTPVTIRGNQVIVPVRIVTAGRRLDLRLVLDTGASRTVIHQQALRNISLNVRQKGKAVVAGGGLIDMQHVIIERAQFGPYTFENHTIAVIESTGKSFSDGLLGMDLLAHSGYKIDFAEQAIIWNAEQYEKANTLIAELKGENTPPPDDAAAPVTASP